MTPNTQHLYRELMRETRFRTCILRLWATNHTLESIVRLE